MKSVVCCWSEGQVRVYSAGLENRTKKENRTETVKKETLRVVHVKGSEYGTFGPRW